MRPPYRITLEEEACVPLITWGHMLGQSWDQVSLFRLPPGNSTWCGDCLHAAWSLQGPQFSPRVALQPPTPPGLRAPRPAVPALTGG